MIRRVLPIILCFFAGMLGAMVGNGLHNPARDDDASTQRFGEWRIVETKGSVVSAANTGAVPGTASSSRSNNPVIKAIAKVGPAVVNIDTLVMRRQSMFGFSDPFFEEFFGNDPFSRLVPSKGQGSGVIIDGNKGYVLTNEHVVRDARLRSGEIKVSLPNRETYEAKVVGADPQYDIAVLKIEGKGLPEVKLASSDDLVIGETAIAVGNPFGFRNTVTVGVISAVDRALESGNTKLEGLIQTDAAINPGNSGGPLCDIEGNVIGINTAIISGAEGLGFAIGASSVKPVVEEIVQHGYVKHGWSGMRFSDISQRLATRLGLDSVEGALVVEVMRNSSADRAGIKPGDVVLQANGKKVSTVADIQEILRKARAGDELAMQLMRNEKKINIKITLDDVPEQLRG